MASLASLVSLGSSGACSSSTNFEVSLFVRRVSLPRSGCNCSFRHLGGGKRWRCALVCRYSLETDYVSEEGNTLSLENSTRGASKDVNTDLLLKPSPRLLLKPESGVKPRSEVNFVPSVLPDADADSGNWKLGDLDEKKVIESLDEVLEKAEKLVATKPELETTKPKLWERRRDGSAVNKPISSPKNGRAVNSSEGGNATVSKGVWRRGNPVTDVKKVIKEPVKVDEAEKAVGRPGVGGKLEPQRPAPVVSAPVAPAPPSNRGGIQLQAKPAVVPPPIPLKRPVILKDVGAASKSPETVVNGAAADVGRTPILVDKYATKKPVIDPVLEKELFSPRKPTKIPSAKINDAYGKKNASSGGLRRRMVDDVETSDDATAEIGVLMPSASAARKGRKWSKASRKAARLQAALDAAPVRAEILEVGEKGMLLSDLAHNLAVGEGEIFGFLYEKGVNVGGVQTLDKDIVKMVCAEYEVEVIDVAPVRLEDKARKKKILDEDDLDKLEERPPVITIMGHVDHGKTTLLDHIRKSKVAASEAGGITQGIGAYRVSVPVDGKLQPCVFLDTPGHEAFGAMRARGARVTDIAIIVVAADDGIRPQTNEAIAHAKAAEVPIVIAINKIDKDGASPERVMQELSSIGLMPEEWGGDVPMVQISALKGDNIDDLLETVMLVAELQELKANPHRSAKGTVIEAALHKSKGPVATFIVQNGTLRRGDIVICGEAHGKVRALFDDGGNNVNEAGPSTPVQVMGLNTVPFAGDEFEVVSSLDIARDKAAVHSEAVRNERIAAQAGDGIATLSSLASAVSAEDASGLDMHQLNIILKVDVQGSIEAIRQALQVLPHDNVHLKFLLQAAGDVSTSDVDLAVAGKAIIFGFNVKAPGSVKSYADNRGIEIRLYRVIYELIDDVRNAMEGLLDLAQEQVPIGAAEVRAVFTSGSGRAAGCMVTEGKLIQGCGIRVKRKGNTIHSGVLDSLRRVKEAVKEVSAGLECGVGMEDYDEYEEGDILEAFNTVQKKRTLEEASASVSATLEKAGFTR